MNIADKVTEPIFYAIIAMLINLLISYGIYKFINVAAVNKALQQWLKQGIEDSDDQLHLRDIAGTVMILFGALFLWLLLDIILGSLIFNNDKFALIFSVAGISGSLLGVGNLLKK
jgi:hypothetical protein